MSVKKTSLFTMCHYSEFHKITYVNCRRNDLQDGVKFFWANVFSRRRKLFKVAHGRHKILPYVDCVTKEHSCIWNYSKLYRRTFSETNKKFIPSFVKLICLLSFEVCFCRDIVPSFCLVWLCTSASNGIRLKNFAVLCNNVQYGEEGVKVWRSGYKIHSLEQVSFSWPGRSFNTWMQCSKRKHKS